MRMSLLAVGCLALSLVIWPSHSQAATKEKLPEGAKIASLEVYPAEIALVGKYAYAQVLVTAQLENGDKIDVTRAVEPTVSQDLAVVSPTGVVRPKTDGDGQITFAVADKNIAVPLKVVAATADYTASFVRDVMPAMSKMG